MHVEPARVLIVDDHEAVRQGHVRILAQHGYRADAVDSAEAALAALRATPFDAVLSDISMPGMSGLELAKELRAAKIDVPIILITGNPELGTAIEAVELGILRYLKKPVERLALVTATQEVIRLHGLARAERLALDNESLRSLVDELHRAGAAAEAGARAKNAFLAMMGHELRTPMTAVVGYTELLLDDPLSDEHRAWLTQVKTSAEQMMKLVQHLLDLSALAGGEGHLGLTTFDVWGTVVEAATPFRREASAKGLALRMDVEPGIPALLRGDAQKLSQVVEHLLSNAVKFTAKGEIGVRMTLEHAPGDETTQAFVVVRLAVTDTGIGIQSHALERVRAPFSQGDESSTREHGGAGLGLAIASELVRLMGGVLGIESVVGVGTTVHFTTSLSMPQSDGPHPSNGLGKSGRDSRPNRPPSLATHE